MKPSPSNVSVYVDSDVIISALITQGGASSALIGRGDVELFTSLEAIEEQKIVVSRLGLSKAEHKVVLEKYFAIVSVTKQQISAATAFVTDPYDSHIAAGAVASRASFLATYNTKHFKHDHLKSKHNIITIKPGFLLQYLRFLQGK